MIISRTPLRVSFAGGGTDFPGFYKEHGGAILSTTINKYIYVIVNKRFDDRIRLSYSHTEIVDNVQDMQHEIVRECLYKTGIYGGIEIATIADIPSEGTGLGSSSALTVGLLNALYTYKGITKNSIELAEEACVIEIVKLNKPIGVQDQYATAMGGVNIFKFYEDDNVGWRRLFFDTEALEKHILLFYTGITRDASSILKEQVDTIEDNTQSLIEMKNKVEQVKWFLINNDMKALGKSISDDWERKKKFSSKITNPIIDAYYDKAMFWGAYGARLVGAGGGGHLLIIAPPKNQQSLRNVFSDLKELKVKIEPEGSKIVYHERTDH